MEAACGLCSAPAAASVACGGVTERLDLFLGGEELRAKELVVVLDLLLELVLRRLLLLSSAFLRLSALIASLSAFLFCFLSNLINFLAATSSFQGIGMAQKKNTGLFSYTSKLSVVDPQKLGKKDALHLFV